jgi:hypothetical protein
MVADMVDPVRMPIPGPAGEGRPEGALRNKLDDTHGGGPKRARPAARHAEPAVNLTGSMATFLVATLEANGKPKRAAAPVPSGEGAGAALRPASVSPG